MEGYSSHSWEVRGVPAAAEASKKLQQPEARCAIFWGSWPRITEPSAVAGCTGSQEGVGSDLHLLTGHLVAAMAAVEDLPLGTEIAAVACAYPWSSCRWCPAIYECTEKEALMVGPPLSLHTPQQWSLASLAGPGFFPDSLSCGALAPSGCLHAAKPSLLPGV